LAEAWEPVGEGPPRVHAAGPLLRPRRGLGLQMGRHSGTEDEDDDDDDDDDYKKISTMRHKYR